MTEQELKEIEARANAATPGKWEENLECLGEYKWWVSTGPFHPCNLGSKDPYLARAKADSAFIAHAREDVPALIAEVRLWHRAKKALHYAMDREIINTCPFCSRDTRENHSEDCPIFTPEGYLK